MKIIHGDTYLGDKNLPLKTNPTSVLLLFLLLYKRVNGDPSKILNPKIKGLHQTFKSLSTLETICSKTSDRTSS